jgi:hypothetical protein
MESTLIASRLPIAVYGGFPVHDIDFNEYCQYSHFRWEFTWSGIPDSRLKGLMVGKTVLSLSIALLIICCAGESPEPSIDNTDIQYCIGHQRLG